MNDFDILSKQVEIGLEGQNQGIPMGFVKLNRYTGIRKRMYTLVFGSTGSGKSAFVNSSYILNPFDWYVSSANDTNIKLKIILFSQERSKMYTQMKWISRKIFLQEGVLIQIGTLLGWAGYPRLTSDEHDLFKMCEDYILAMNEVVDIVESPQNPTGVYKYVKEYAEANGVVEKISEYKKIYIPNNENEIVIPISDHAALTKPEKQQNKKEAIDKLSEYFQLFRDFYGYSPVVVSQVNRDISNPIYKKMDNFEPNLDQVKESGRLAEDVDTALCLFQPHRYKTNDVAYDTSKFIDQTTGGDYFRKIIILKNTYGESDIGIGMAFHGATGTFKELPRARNMDNFDYSSLFNGSYFLDNSPRERTINKIEIT